MAKNARWPAEEEAYLRSHWLQKHLSANQIAKMLRKAFPDSERKFTRLSIIGKAHRLRLPRKGNVKKLTVIESGPTCTIHEESPELPDGAEPWMCRWRTDEPGKYGLHICAKTAQPGRPLCAEHNTAAYLRRKNSAVSA